MISRKTLLRNVSGFFVSAKELKERGFKFFKLLVLLLGGDRKGFLISLQTKNFRWCVSTERC